MSPTEFLTLHEVLRQRSVGCSVDEFYAVARATLVKDERHYDRYDRVFSEHLAGIEPLLASPSGVSIPEDWLRAIAELDLSEEERRKIVTMGGFDALLAALEERLREQRGRHEGGSKWIGTAGRSPFGAHGDNPEGVRIGQDRSRQRSAIKVWDRRDFRNLDGAVELGTRNMKLALRRLRRFAREGAAEELDLGGTIDATARNAGMLDLKLRPERRNTIKLLLFFDVGGSMDDHVRVCEELFSAARSEFRQLEYFYFHNCVYESVWKDNRRRHEQRLPTSEILRTYGPDYRLVFVGDAAMGPYEIVQTGGSVEHWNDEPGAVWLERLLKTFTRAVWLNPEPEARWSHVASIGLMQRIVQGRMFPLTPAGIDRAMRALNSRSPPS